MSIYTTGSLELRGTADTLFLTASHDAVGPKIGIGTAAAPGTTFAINADLGLTDTATQVRFSIANNDATGDASLNLGNSVSNRAFILWEGGTDRRLRFGTRASGVNYFNTLHMKDGAVGIGGDPELSSPAVDLHVKGTSKAAMIGENATEPAAASIAYFGNANTLIQRQSGADSAAEFQLQSACATDISVTARSGTNAAGRSMTVSAGQGTGTGNGGDLTLKAAPGSASGSSVNSYTNTLTISGQEAKATFTGKVLVGGDTAAGDDAAIGYTATEGIIITGQGSSTDFAIKNDADQTLISAATGTTIVDLPQGRLAIGEDADGSDRKLQFGHSTIKSVIGIDDSQDVFAINTDQDFELSNDLEIDASGNVTVGNGNLIIDGGEVRGPENGTLKLYSDGNVTVEIDSDNSGTDAKFIVAANNETSKFEVDESGNVQMDGDLTVDGDDITFSGNGTLFSDGGSLTLRADTNMFFRVDVDNTANNYYEFQNSSGTKIMTMTEGTTPSMTLGRTGTSFDLIGPENSNLNIISDNDVTITLDNDNNGDGELLVKDGAGVTIFKLEEDNKLTLGKTGSPAEVIGTFGLTLQSAGTDQDMIFKVNDNGTDFTAMTIDGSAAGTTRVTPLAGGDFIVQDTGDKGSFKIAGDGRFNFAEHNSDEADEAPMLTFYRTRGTNTTPTAVAADDHLGSLRFYGYDTHFGASAEIRGVAAAAHGSSGDATDSPGKIEFYTAPDGTSTLTLAMTINSDQTTALAGDITVGGNTIRASDGGATIQMDTSDNVTIGNDLTVGGNTIRASDGGATITMDTSDNVTIGGDLRINGNDIKDSGGNTVFSFDGSGRLDSGPVVIRGTTAHKLTLWEQDDSDGGVGPEMRFYRTQDTLSAGSNLGEIWFYGSEDDADFHAGAAIIGEADGAWDTGTDDCPGRLTFYTTADGAGNVSERMRLTSEGNLGIGSTTTSTINAYRLLVQQEDGSGHIMNIRNTSANSNADGLAIRISVTGNPTDTNNYITFTKSGGTSVDAIEGDGAGGAHFTGTAAGTPSDMRLKEDLKPIESALETVKSLELYDYKLKNVTGKADIRRQGFSAQQLVDICPQAVYQPRNINKKTGEAYTEGDENYKYMKVNPGMMTPIVTAALQEAITQIEDLKSRIEALEKS